MKKRCHSCGDLKVFKMDSKDKFGFCTLGFLVGWNIFSLMYFIFPKNLFDYVLQWFLLTEIVFLLIIVIVFISRRGN